MFLHQYWIFTSLQRRFTWINEFFQSAYFQSWSMGFASVEPESPPSYYLTLEWTKLLRLLCSNFPPMWINRQNAALNVTDLKHVTQGFEGNLTYYTFFKNWTQSHTRGFFLRSSCDVNSFWWLGGFSTTSEASSQFCLWQTFSFSTAGTRGLIKCWSGDLSLKTHWIHLVLAYPFHTLALMYSS